MKANIKQISRITGFSPATVSNALNRKKGVNGAGILQHFLKSCAKFRVFIIQAAESGLVSKRLGLPLHPFDHIRKYLAVVNDHPVLSVCNKLNSLEYLIQKGHRKIGYLKGDYRIKAFCYREYGYERALLRHGLKVERGYAYPEISGCRQ